MANCLSTDQWRTPPQNCTLTATSYSDLQINAEHILRQKNDDIFLMITKNKLKLKLFLLFYYIIFYEDEIRDLQYNPDRHVSGPCQ